MHEITKYKIMHIAHAYVPATSYQCCMWEYQTKQKAIALLKTTKRCVPLLKYYAPGGIGYCKGLAKGINSCVRLEGSLQWPQSLHNQEQDDLSLGTIEKLKHQAKQLDISGITHS